MEEWQKSHIDRKKNELMQNTEVTIEFLAILRSEGILSNGEEEMMAATHLTRLQKSSMMYDVVKRKTGAYAVLKGALQKTKQSGALQILNESRSQFKYYGCITVDKSQLLGKGCFNTKVYKGSFDNRDVAVKVIMCDNEEDDPDAALKEVEFLKKLDYHENIVRYFAAERKGSSVYIALELCVINLHQWVSSKQILIPEKYVLIQSTRGLSHLHSNEIVHRDLNPVNILLTSNKQVKIADFGLAKRIPNEATVYSLQSMVIGTEGWMAPEILQNQSAQGIISLPATDIFSLGCIMYFVLTSGTHPFGDQYRRQGNILDGRPQFKTEVHAQIPEDALGLILSMISRNPLQRPSVHSILSSAYLHGRCTKNCSHACQVNALGETQMPPTLVPKNAEYNSKGMVECEAAMRSNVVPSTCAEALNVANEDQSGTQISQKAEASGAASQVQCIHALIEWFRYEDQCSNFDPDSTLTYPDDMMNKATLEYKNILHAKSLRCSNMDLYLHHQRASETFITEFMASTYYQKSDTKYFQIERDMRIRLENIFRSALKSSLLHNHLVDREINILLLGEIGSGKSSWVNSLISNFIEEFTHTKVDLNVHSSNSGYRVNSDHLHTISRTPNIHKFNTGTTIIRIIDAPGIGEVTGVRQDRFNMEIIMQTLLSLVNLHGICIFLTPNIFRHTEKLNYCITELLTHFARDAIKNVIFCVNGTTVSSNSSDNIIPVLKRVLDESMGNKIVLSRDNFYYFNCGTPGNLLDTETNNENTLHDNLHQYSPDRRTDFVRETIRMLEHISVIVPHTVKNTLDLNHARKIILNMAGPMSQIIMEIGLQKTTIDHGITTITDVPSQEATVDNIEYSEWPVVLDDMSKEVLECETELTKILNIVSSLARSVKGNEMGPYNDHVEKYLSILIRERNANTASCIISQTLETLQDTKAFFRDQTRILNRRADVKHGDNWHGPLDIPAAMRELRTLKHYGKILEKAISQVLEVPNAP